jgi:deoxyribodipyrimidine photo-lyase
MSGINIFWFRRDLRLKDNVAMSQACNDIAPTKFIFIFDKNIIDELPKNDARVSFIYNNLKSINKSLDKISSSIQVFLGDPKEIFEDLLAKNKIKSVFVNKDYEPYAVKRDKKIKIICESNGVGFKSFKDQVIFEEGEIVKDDKTPYTVYTPFKKKWLKIFNENPGVYTKNHKIITDSLHKSNLESAFCNWQNNFPVLNEIGFTESDINVKDFNLDDLDNYSEKRNIPFEDSTSYLSPHLRFGTISIRRIVDKLKDNEVFLSELIWREFFMQVLYHFPDVVHSNFKSKYDGIKWRNKPAEFEKWKKGETGFPIVDAGMRQLANTGYMHNRVRMIVASFLIKDLLIDWRWGEAYFAEKLLDYELSSNNGNWQWAAGTGCDAAPYFRVFNPHEQLKKFDPELKYVRKWVEDFDELTYPEQILDHKEARLRTLNAYKAGIIE